MPLRPAWLEIDLQQLRRNLALIRSDMPVGVRWCSVVKDQAYGHGAVTIAQETVKAGAAALAVATIAEGLELREHGLTIPILIFGERTEAELEHCLAHNLTCFVNDVRQATRLDQLAAANKRRVAIHVEIDTGLSRFGVRWENAAAVIQSLRRFANLHLAGIMTHFAMSDELDKTFANLQLSRFMEALHRLAALGIHLPLRHACNTGGFLDLPQAHFDMVRLGILPLGVYPSKVCRRIAGLKPILSVKARVAALQHIQPGDHVGYGMRYTADSSRTIAVLPVGYGDGLPRVRNAGHVLIHGHKAPIVGGNAMDATMVDVTHIPEVRQWDETVLLGRQGEEEITAHDLAALGSTVSYDVMTKLGIRLQRVYE